MAMDDITHVGVSPCSEQLTVSPPSLTPITMVAKLIDQYLMRVARDAQLKVPEFHALAAAVPHYARPLHDDLYHAIDVYLESHLCLGESDKEQLCRSMDCQKLSLEACTHAAKKKRLPRTIIVQVLFFEQLQHRRTSMDGSRQSKSGIVGSNEGGGCGTAAVRGNQVLKAGMDNMRMRLSRIEKECSNMRQEIEKECSCPRNLDSS